MAHIKSKWICFAGSGRTVSWTFRNPEQSYPKLYHLSRNRKTTWNSRQNTQAECQGLSFLKTLFLLLCRFKRGSASRCTKHRRTHDSGDDKTLSEPCRPGGKAPRNCHDARLDIRQWWQCFFPEQYQWSSEEQADRLCSKRTGISNSAAECDSW